MEDDDPLSTDAFLKRTKRRHSNRKCSAQLYQTPQQVKTAAWLPFPEEPSVSGLEDLVGPATSSQLYMDFKPSKSSASDFFTTSLLLCPDGNAANSQHWQDSLFRSKSKETPLLDSFESSFMKHTNTVREQSFGSQYYNSRMQPPFNYQAKHPDRYSTEEMQFPHQQDPFKTSTHPFAQSISSPKYRPLQSTHFPAFNKFTDHSYLPYSPHSNTYTDMRHLTQSHTLGRGSQTPGSSFPSPEHWSFPAMRLY
ncbi:uncharacterized protein LOC115397157 [Salarias fasciatus]|uniref:uncharacterized protein LOC115397157 n=1 Tax=Salarias fasciatus TaxID=181472 RepID=UPI0011769C12|nr:uncharacterized protein LOC115397157 [Salarias fasciatus]